MDQNKSLNHYLIALIRAQWLQETPPEKPADISFEDIYKLAKIHCVDNLVYYAVERLAVGPEPELLAKWAANVNGNIIKVMNQVAELNRISQRLDELNINHLPLKGALLVHLFPQMDYRHLGDLDILVPDADKHEASQVLLQDGYKAADEDKASYHKEFIKNFGAFDIHIELHHDLVNPSSEHYLLYQNPWQTLNLEKVSRAGYQMTKEDFYVFLLVHMAKHYYTSGTGIRSILDIDVYLQHYGEELDFAYIDQKLSLVGLVDFRHEIERLTTILLHSGTIPEELVTMTDNLLNHGLYGDWEYEVSNRLSKQLGDKQGSKLGYLLSQTFLPYSVMRGFYPVLDKHAYLLPYFWGKRLVKALLSPDKRGRIIYHLKKVSSYKSK